LTWAPFYEIKLICSLSSSSIKIKIKIEIRIKIKIKKIKRRMGSKKARCNPGMSTAAMKGKA
jgi:hypothetical protein